MKELVKAFFSWILGLFNVGVYCADGVDSLIQHLNFLGLQHQANEIVRLYQLLEHQSQMLLVLDGLRTGLMLLSLIFLFIINFQVFKSAFYWCKSNIKSLPFFFKQLKTKFKKWLM
ncbi:hypothetical protein [Aureispira anguillae]|uniref:Uncharacterized protein n=1 Tax=Aureispira anguillae TaxID=2864201 RepID=A0A915YFX8_9BACT|nr:hypothetical protein [Aureispira anguillae]BDS12383.1 hypothetical protein AsAng_0031040 [Aureispira anguillae]